MTLKPRERVLRALDALLPYLHGFVNQAFESTVYQGKRVDADILPLAHAVRSEWRGVFSARLDRPVQNYVHELIDIRNRLAHSKQFDEDEARRACDTIRLVAKAIRAPLAEFDRVVSPAENADPVARVASETAAVRKAAAPPKPAALVGRRQVDVMREIWARCAPDEQRTISEYAAAEQRGEVTRKRNSAGLDSEQYARALLRDGLRKGWL